MKHADNKVGEIEERFRHEGRIGLPEFRSWWLRG